MRLIRHKPVSVRENRHHKEQAEKMEYWKKVEEEHKKEAKND